MRGLSRGCLQPFEQAMRSRIHLSAAKALWVALAPFTLNHAIAAALPSAGSQLQQIPPAPAAEKVSPQVRIEAGAAPVTGSADGVTIVVNSLHVIHAAAFSETDLIAATGFQPGSELTLSALRGFATSIANYYRSHGYLLAQATLPPQDVVEGTVTIAVAEGQYGKVILRNQSNLGDDVAQRLLEGLNSGDTITIAPLESRLLQLSDLPGVNVKSTLVPGAIGGATDLIVDVTPGRRLSGSADVDNAGSRYTGDYRMGATVNFNNPLGRGDVATLRALTSWDGLNYGRASYQRRFGRADAGVAYTALDYELGREFESLQAHGTAQIASVFGRYPLLRSRSHSTYAQLGVDARKFRDEVDATTPETVSDKKAQAVMLSLIGDHHDRFGGGGWNTYSLSWTAGRLDLESAEAMAIDAATARSDGRYDKLGIEVTRLQAVTDSISLYAALQGQLSSQNLDVSEKMGLGGANAVRAYPEGEAYVDRGYLLNLEARLRLPNLVERLPGHWQLLGFIDTATGRLAKDPWDEERNHRTLSGAGIGLHWFDAGSFVVRAYYAHTLGSAAVTSGPDKDSRFWINTVKYF